MSVANSVYQETRGLIIKPYWVLLLLTFCFLLLPLWESVSVLLPIVGVCKCSMFCCTLLYVHSSFAISLMGKRELVALLILSLGVS